MIRALYQLHADQRAGDDATAIDPLVAMNNDHRPPPADRPWVLSNMVTTLDGATAVDGVSGPLGGPADKKVFSAIRSVADVVLAGAATVIEERYRPPAPSEPVLAMRRSQGRSDRALIAVVTASLRLPLDLPLFTDDTYRPLVITTTEASAERRSALQEVADILALPPNDDGRVPLRSALEELSVMGHHHVLCEGGPALNGQLVADDLIDEWNLTLSPLLVGGSSSRPAHGSEGHGSRAVSMTRLWEADGLLFGRWLRNRGA